MERLVSFGGKVALCLVLVACGSPDAEPGVPTSAAARDGRVLRVPAQADGTLDTVGLPVMRFDESTYAFGAVDAGAIVEHRFRFRNAGAQPLQITNASSTCGCTVPVWPREPVAPGDTASIYVRFDTGGKSGPQDKAVTLTANTFPNTTEVHLVGTVDAIF